MSIISKRKRPDIHEISLLVANKPGVLVRCALVFARRGYNIDSLVVSPSVNPKYSRMTITAQGDPKTLDQIIKQTGKLVDVIHCSEHTGVDSVDRELSLFKVKCPPAKKSSLLRLAKKAKAQILNQSQGAVILEKSGITDELDALEESLKEFGIIEMVRSGKLVMAVGKEPT